MPMRPPFRALMGFAFVLGLSGGAVEVLLRASPRQGLDAAAVATWLGASMGLGVAACVVFAVVARLGGPRGYGVILALFLGLHGAVNYRFELVLNEFVRDPRVWGGILLVLAVSGVIGLALGGWVARMRRPLLVLGVIATVGAFVRARPEQGTAGEHPSVLVITLDTTRPDRLSPYGRDIETPALQRLADEGVTFEQAIAAAPITEPSHLALFTGDPPLATGVVSNGTRLGARPKLLWHALGGAGYITAGFVAGFPLHGKYGWGQGMDVYDDDFGATAGLESLSIVKAWNQVAVKEHALRERPASQVLARAVPWLRAHRDEQFFLWVHLYDPHGPYVSRHNAELGEPPLASGPMGKLPAYWPPAMRRVQSNAWLAAAYEGELRTVDAAVGELLEALGPALERTVVTVTADHGESLGEHDYWFDHGDDLHDPSLKIPWIVRWPAVARAGSRVDCQVGGVDLTPTLLALAGVADGETREGISRVPELEGELCRERPLFASTVAGRLVADPPVDHALRGQGHKLILPEGRPPELYDLSADPRELQNLAPNALSGTMGAIVAGRARSASVSDPEQDATTQELLELLGYTDD